MQLEIENNRINKLIETTFKNLNQLVDVNTVVGKPISSDNGEYIVPISKVTICVMMGGGEYGKTGILKKASDLPYSAANGAVVSVKPCGFLVKDENHYKVLSVYDKTYEKILNRTIDMFSGVVDEEN